MATARDSIAKEMLQTERSYVENLQTTIELFISPLKVYIAKGKPIVKEEVLDGIFSNLELIVNVNVQLLDGLEQRLGNWSNQQCVGDVFMTLAPFLKSYTQYCNRFEESNEVLHRTLEGNSKFKRFVKKGVKNARCKGLDLESFLIMPVQRIPRYILLLRDMLKHTEPSHPDYANLQQSIEAMSSVAKEVNDSVARFQRSAKLVSIEQELRINIGLVQPNREFIEEWLLGNLLEGRTKPRNVKIYVLNDMLIFAEEGRYLDRAELSMVWTQDGDYSIDHSFSLLCPTADEQKKWLFICDSEEEMMKVVSIIDKATNALLKNKPFYNVKRGEMWESMKSKVAVERSMSGSEIRRQRKLEKKQATKRKLTKDDSKFQTLRF